MTFNMCDWGKPGQEERARQVVDIVREHAPHVLFAQEYYLTPPGDANAEAAAARFAEATGMDGYAAMAGYRTWPEGDGYACLGLGISWRHPIATKPGSWRVIRPDVCLAGITLLLDGIDVEHYVYHGAARLGRNEAMVQNMRIAEAQVVAEVLTGEGTNRLGVVAGDWNTLGADRTDSGSYWHPDPALPDTLTAAAAQLARSRAAGEVLWQAGLVSAAAHLGSPLAPSTGHIPWADWKGTNYGYRLIDEGFLTRDLAVALVSHTVLDTPQTRAVSDHLPVMFTIDTRRMDGS